MMADIDASISVGALSLEAPDDEGKQFAIFRLACHVKRLWFVHVSKTAGITYPDFYRTREAYAKAAAALHVLSGRPVIVDRMVLESPPSVSEPSRSASDCARA